MVKSWPKPVVQRDSLPQLWLRWRRDVVIVTLAIVLALLGYWLAPADLRLGAYEATVQAILPDRTLSLTYPFELVESDAGYTATFRQRDGSYTVIVEGQTAVTYALGERLQYKVQVRDENGRLVPLQLEQVQSTIVGEGYEQILPPTGVDGEWTSFSMRLPYKAPIALALLLVVVLLWLSERIPLAATALLIPVVVVGTQITDATTILQPFAHPIVVLFLAGFLLAEGMQKTAVDRYLAVLILRRAGLRPAVLMLIMMALTAFLSMWMSNTASVAVLIPIALAILAKLPKEAGETGFRRALILGVAYAGAIGGVGSAIGTPANMLALTFLNDLTGSELVFIDWFAYGLPMVIVMVPIIWLYLLLTFRVQVEPFAEDLHDVYVQESESAQMTVAQRWVLFVFLLVVVLWLTEQWHHVSTAIVALAGVFVFFFSGILQEEALRRINWNALLTFGGGLAMGSLLVSTGVSDWIALRLVGLAAYPAVIVVLLVASMTLVTGAFISNTACAAMLIPMAIPLAQLLQIDPRLMVAVIAIASSIDFALVIGTPPTMMAYATGLFKSEEIFRRGVVLDVIGVLVLSLGVVWLWRWFGLVG